MSRHSCRRAASNFCLEPPNAAAADDADARFTYFRQRRSECPFRARAHISDRSRDSDFSPLPQSRLFRHILKCHDGVARL